MVHQVVWSDTEQCPAGGHVEGVGAITRGESEPRDWSVDQVAHAVADGAYFFLVDEEGFPQLVAPARCSCGAPTLVGDPGPREASTWTLRLMTRRSYLWEQATSEPRDEA